MGLKTKKPIYESETNWKSIWIISTLTLCAMIQFTLFFSSTYPYLISLDPSVTERFYGVVVAAYSAGQIIGSPMLGRIADKTKTVRIPIAIGIVLSFIGNVVYIAGSVVPVSWSKYLVLLGRFVVGFGGSNVGVMRSYASMASSKNDRSRAIALINGGYSTGSVIGPCLQLLFTPFGYPGIQLTGKLHLSTYTSPALCAMAINAIGLLCLYFCFEERYAGVVDKSTLKSNEDKKTKVLPSYDVLAVFVVHLVTFAQRFSFTNLESISGPLGMAMFSWNKQETVEYIAIAHGAVSLLTLLVNMAYFMFKMEKILDFRVQCIVGLFGLLAFHLISFSWPFLPNSLTTYSQEEYDVAIANGTEVVGCNVDRFAWCETTKPVNVWVYYGAYVLFIGIFYPSIQVTINTLFSKVLGPRLISTHQGFLQVTSSSARLTGPLLITNLYTSFGPRYAWYLEFLVLGLTIAIFCGLFKRMIPLELPAHISTLSTIKIQPLDQNKLSVNSFTNQSYSSQSTLSDCETNQESVQTTRSMI
ncbi:hypothetical protein M3Y94_00739800 [Aphelenchoides besseyi]|nr:hypothetical protein M3Y94_00739800 [Aphelenchoides besseyi]KAI6231970.1 hypothetical protein M3Y95_00437600 [Aphelenchoides besseyi]